MPLAMQLLAEHGIRRMWVIDSMHDASAALETARLAKRAGASEVVVGLVYSLSPVHTPELYRQLAERVTASSDVDAVYIKDPGGLLTPDTTAEVIEAVRPQIDEL